MASPDRDHRGGRFECMIKFDMPSTMPGHIDVREFIKEWLECGGGSRHPDDPLFHSLGQVTVSGIKRIAVRR